MESRLSVVAEISGQYSCVACGSENCHVSSLKFSVLPPSSTQSPGSTPQANLQIPPLQHEDTLRTMQQEETLSAEQFEDSLRASHEETLLIASPDMPPVWLLLTFLIVILVVSALVAKIYVKIDDGKQQVQPYSV